jgi:regulator of sigma E protease
MLVTLISFFLILIVCILVHELGHFFTAKLFKVRVEEFGIFMPPRIFAFKKGETTYSLNAIPLGGFNKLAGEEDPKVAGSLAGKSIPVRLLVLSAGSLMNILLPLILISIALMLPHLTAAEKGDVFVGSVQAESPAASAGIKATDYLVAVNGATITSAEEYVQIIQANLGKEITVLVRHSNGEEITVRFTPRTETPHTGVSIETVTRESLSFWQAIPQGAVSYWNMIVLFKDGIVGMIRGTVPINVTGPVGLAQMTGEVVKTGFANLLSFAAVISLNLGILNIFPIPAMDGGRIVFVLLEWVRRGKRVSPKTEGMVHTIGYILLMILFLIIAYKDILRIINGGSLI